MNLSQWTCYTLNNAYNVTNIFKITFSLIAIIPTSISSEIPIQSVNKSALQVRPLFKLTSPFFLFHQSQEFAEDP